MLNRKDFYAIEVEVDECHSTQEEYFETYEEAFKNRMKYANWYRPQGDVWIVKMCGKTLRKIEEWHINASGKAVSHYCWKK